MIFLVLLLGAPAHALVKGPRGITGKLSKPGYTVIALADNGRATTVQAKGGRFKLRLPAAGVSLHLRAPNGTYAGPVVIGSASHGKRAILGVMAGAKLGKVRLAPAKGYAKVKRGLAEKWIDPRRWARAKGGRPIGNGGNVGLVRSLRARGTANDRDRDGVPGSLDIDDDGDLILDDYDTATGPRAPRLAVQSATRAPLFALITELFMAGPEAVNVNGGSSNEQIAAAQQGHQRIAVLWGGVDPGSAELDCGALVYCSAGGTGRYQLTGSTQLTDSPFFPACCDPDADGLGSLIDTPPSDAANDFHGMSLWTGATADQLRADDVLIERATRDGAALEMASSVGFVFTTFPAIAAYDDMQGNSGTFSYPHANSVIPVRAGPNGEVIVKLTFWRPQRHRIGGDPGEGEWIDVGNLDYVATGITPEPGAPSPSGPSVCPLSSYSNIDPNLTPQSSSPTLPPGFGASYLEDQVGDVPSNPANTFTYTLNLTACLAANGHTMKIGEAAAFSFHAFATSPPPGSAVFAANFQLQP